MYADIAYKAATSSFRIALYKPMANTKLQDLTALVYAIYFQLKYRI